MKPSPYRPRTHVYVCANRRADDDPLGSGCGEQGERVFAQLKRLSPSTVWVSKTLCLGLCPKRGCTLAVAPAMQYLVEVEESDVGDLVSALNAGQ